MSDQTELAEAAHQLDEKTKRIRRGDLIISPVMIVGGLWFAYDSFMMSYGTIQSGEATIPTSPGLLPFLISLLIVACSVAVLRNAIRSGADLSFLAPEVIKRVASKFENWTALLVMAMFAVYVFVLIGRIPFIAATILFGVAMMGVFKAAKPIWIAVITVTYATIVVYCFSTFAATQFPMSVFS